MRSRLLAAGAGERKDVLVGAAATLPGVVGAVLWVAGVTGVETARAVAGQHPATPGSVRPPAAPVGAVAVALLGSAGRVGELEVLPASTATTATTGTAALAEHVGLLADLAADLLAVPPAGEPARQPAPAPAGPASCPGEDAFRTAFDHAPTGMTMLGLAGQDRGRVLRVNDAMCRMLGRAPGELAGMRLADWTVAGEVQREEDRLAALYAGDVRLLSYDKRYRHASGRTVHAWVTSAVVLDDAGRPSHLVSHAVDLTERVEAERELQRLAQTDVLTGLANRALLAQRTRSALLRRRRGGDRLALLMLDLDRFKLINDTLGHHAGDELLIEVAARLQALARAGTTVARLGGDEFVLLLDGVGSPAEAVAVAERVGAALRRPVELSSGDSVVCSASIGIALSEPGSSAADVHRQADLALYRAKELGRDRAALFDEELRARAMTRLDSETRLRRALAEDGVRVHHQPLVDVLTGQVVGHEALVRVHDPERGLVPPDDFVDIAEDTGLVLELDARVLELAVAALARTPAGLLAVNVSGRSLADGGYPDRLGQVLARNRVAASRLLVEVTEHSLLDLTPAVTRSLAAIAELGARTGIDDFGTGYSALAYLQRFRLDFLKIDKSFVARLGRSGRDDAVVAAIVDLAHAHDLTVTAEGVETLPQLERLRAMGCDRVQGYLFGRPRPELGPVGPVRPVRPGRPASAVAGG